MLKTKNINRICTTILITVLHTNNLVAQNHRHDRYDGPVDTFSSLKWIIIGGVIWGIGMLLGLLLRKDNDKTIKEGQIFLTGIVQLFVIGGVVIIAINLILLGF